MKRRVYGAVSADIDRSGLKSAIKALFDDIARKNNIPGYTIKSLRLDKTGVRKPRCTCTIYYELEGYASWYSDGPYVELDVPVGLEIPKDYYLDDPKIEEKILSDDISQLSELDALEAQATDIFEYFTKAAEDLAHQYNLTIKCRRYPEKLKPGKYKFCSMSAKVVDADTKYTTNLDTRFDFLEIQSGRYRVNVHVTVVNIHVDFSEGFSKQIIDEELKRGFKKFDSELRDAERKLASAQDTADNVDELLQLNENLCESSGCVFESDDRRFISKDGTVNVDYLGNINCYVTYANKSTEFWLASYVNKPIANVKKSIQSRIRRLKDTDTKPRSKKYEQEDLSWL